MTPLPMCIVCMLIAVHNHPQPPRTPILYGRSLIHCSALPRAPPETWTSASTRCASSRQLIRSQHRGVALAAAANAAAAAAIIVIVFFALRLILECLAAGAGGLTREATRVGEALHLVLCTLEC